MGNLLFLYFLHPITTRLANKTQRIYSRDELTNPTKNPPPPFVFSLLSVILRHLHYTLQPPFYFIYHPFLPLLLPPVLMLPCLLFPCYYPLFLCYSVSSYPVSPLLILCYYPLFSCYPVSFNFVTIPLFLCYSVSFYPVPPPYRVKNVYLSYPQGPLLCPIQGLSSMQNMPFLPLEDALLVP